MAPRRPRRVASGAIIRQPRIVPVARSIVAHDAIRAACAVSYPSRTATCVTAPGTYTEPAHRPIMEIKTNRQLNSVRLRYSGEKSATNESRVVQDPTLSNL